MLSQKPWRIEAVIQLVAGVFACLCFGLLTGVLLQKSGLAAFKSPDSFANLVLGTLSSHGSAFVLILIFLKWHAVNWRATFGLRDEKLKRALGLAATMMLVILPVAWCLQYVSALLLQKIGWPVEDQHAVDLFAKATSPWLVGYLVGFALVLAPVVEEFVFRGILFPLIKQLGFPRLAWMVPSLLFALVHVNAPTFLPLFVFALAQTWLYERTDNLLAPMVAHSLFNGANLVVLFFLNR
jgi:membrane protease YdiL (CAAX protease family)